MHKTIGILGGGQLGKMLMEAGSPLNFQYQFLEAKADCPASLVSRNQTIGSLQDAEKINELASKSDVITFEIEHVNTEALEKIYASGKLVIPNPSVLSIIQDKGLQKEFYATHNIPTLDFQLADTKNLGHIIENWSEEKFVLKHRKGGYDGKGVQLLSKTSYSELAKNNDESLHSETGYVVEKMANDAKEISVIVAVAQDGSTHSYEPCEMVFDPKSNLMDYLIVPCSLNAELIDRCKSIAQQVVAAFGSPGLFAVELFAEASGDVYVNEIAPRPHNSGHHTIESAYISQYEQLNRILLGLPLGNCDLITPAATCNIVGPENVNGAYTLGNLDEVLQISGVYIHMYGKKQTSPNRKLGHFTVIDPDKAKVVRKMEAVKELLQVVRI